jgi:hypothetical protein
MWIRATLIRMFFCQFSTNCALCSLLLLNKFLLLDLMKIILCNGSVKICFIALIIDRLWPKKLVQINGLYFVFY